MKEKLIILLLPLTIIAAGVRGQPYESLFGQSKTSWNVAYFFMPDWTLTDSLVVSNDTLINGKTYKSVTNFGDAGFSCFIREDTVSGKAWFLHDSIREYLFMDLSLNVGDTFIIHQLQFPEDSIATVDSVKYIGGIKKIYLNRWIVYSPECLTFIEGIGPNAGITFQLYQSDQYFADGSVLLCSSKDDLPVYVNSGPFFYGQCFVHYGGINENKIPDEDLNISPNPATTHITLQLPPQFEQARTIEVFDRIGQLVLRMDYSAEVDVSGLPVGLYFMVVSNKEGESVTGRFVKE